MEDFYEFIRERAKKTIRWNSNCGGTSLYLVGESDLDVKVSRETLRIKLSRMKESQAPGLGYIVSWELDSIPFHTAVIYKENPFEIVHRNETNGLLTPDNLEKFNKFIFKNTGLNPLYRIPQRLEKQLKNL